MYRSPKVLTDMMPQDVNSSWQRKAWVFQELKFKFGTNKNWHCGKGSCGQGLKKPAGAPL